MKMQITQKKVTSLSLFILALLAVPGRAALFQDNFTNTVGDGVWENDFNWTTTTYPNNGHIRPDTNGDPIPGPNPTYNAVLDIAAACTLGTSVTVEGVSIATGSTLNVANNVVLQANTLFTNNGVVNLNSAVGGTCQLKMANGSGVGATGKILMTDSGTNNLSALAHGNTFTISLGGLIAGAGQLNPGYFGDTQFLLNYVNHGLIDATAPNNPLQIGMGGQVNANLTNTGTLRASNAGTLRIHAFNTSGTVFNSGGTISAIDSGIVRIVSPAVVQGGTLATTGNGSIRGEGAGGTLKDLTNSGTIVVPENETLGFAGEIINNGVISLESPAAGGGAYLVFNDNTTLSGNGILTMSDSDNHGFYAPSNTFTLTIGPSATIEGSGTLWSYLGGNQNPLSLTNQGVIHANHAAHSLLIYLTSVTPIMNNTGILRASDGATLNLLTNSSITTLNNGGGGLIEALDNSTVIVGSGVTVEGGTVSTSGTGSIRSGGGKLSNVTNNGNVVIGLNEVLRLGGTITNNGTILFNSDNPNGGANVFFAGDTTLSGPGALEMTTDPWDVITALAPDSTLTNAAGHTIRGVGRITSIGQVGLEQTYFFTIANAGLIEADITGKQLLVVLRESDGGRFNNTGTLRASNGATVYFQGNSGVGFVTNDGGTVAALSGGTLFFDGNAAFTQTAGTIDLDGGSLSVGHGLDLNGGNLIGSGTITGDIRNNGGTVSPGHSAGSMAVTGNYTQGATGTLEIEIGGPSPGTEFDQLQVTGTVALDGTLKVTLIDGFRPAIGDVFQIITPNGFSGAFATIKTIGFTGQVNYTAGAITVMVVTVPDIPLNISTRLHVLTGENVLIGGFIVTGTEPKKVIIRGIGPSLGTAGVLDPLADPTIELHKPDGSVVTNDNWRTDQEAEIIATTIPPANDLESAIVATLDPGAYTAIVSGKNGSTGTGLIEIYDLGLGAKSKLANISTRGFVDTDDNVLIGGFIMGGNGQENGRAVIRAIGPSLTAFGISNALQDPVLELHDPNGSTLMVNDDWQSSQQAEIEAIGLAPTDIHESAMVISLPDGNYTAVVRGKNNTTGVAIIEGYSIL